MNSGLVGAPRRIALLCIAMGSCGALQAGCAQAAERVTVGNAGEQANGPTDVLGTNGDGRFVVFSSIASNMVADDTNRVYDVFVRDRQSGTTERVSINDEGGQTRTGAFGSSISADGRFVVFFAADLDPAQVPGRFEVFVRDRQLRTTRKVSVTPSGEQANGQSTRAVISSDGRFVAFESEATNLVPDFRGRIFVRDLNAGTTEGLTTRQGQNDCTEPQLNADGRFVVHRCSFLSTTGIYVTDRATQQLELISVTRDGTLPPFSTSSVAPSIDASGRFVAFRSDLPNLVEGDANGFNDIFVRDRQRQTTQLVSVGVGGQPAVFGANFGKLSADGRFMVFQSFSTDLIEGGATTVGDVYFRDLKTGVTRRVSSTPTANSGNGASGTNFDGISISGDGSTVAFISDAGDLVSDDTNERTDGFVQDMLRPAEAEPFAAFRPKVTLLQDVPFLGDQLVATGSFTVSSSGDGIDLVSDDVKVSITGADGKLFEIEIPAGSFTRSGLFIFTQEGKSGLLQISRSRAPDAFSFLLTAPQPTQGLVKNPLTVALQIGDDQGSSTLSCFGSPRLQLCE